MIRDDGERVVCSLWALGGPLEDRLVLDRSGEILEAPAARAREVPPAPLPPVWNSALGDLIARESAPALGPAIMEVLSRTPLEWGAVPGDLVRAWDTRIRLSARLREAGPPRSGAPRRGGSARSRRSGSSSRWRGSWGRRCAAAPRRCWNRCLQQEQARRLGAAAEESEALDESVGRLIALLAR